MKWKTETVTADGDTYLLKELTADQAEECFSPDLDPKTQIRMAIIAALANGGNCPWTLDNIGTEMPARVLALFRNAMLRLIEMETKTADHPEGEASAAATA